MQLPTEHPFGYEVSMIPVFFAIPSELHKKRFYEALPKIREIHTKRMAKLSNVHAQTITTQYPIEVQEWPHVESSSQSS